MRAVNAIASALVFLIIALVAFHFDWGHPKIEVPELIALPNDSFYYRPAGNFRQGNRVVDAPLEMREITGVIEVMKYPVSVYNYAICVNAGFCNEAVPSLDQNFPQIGVSYLDAVDYARWFSEITGEVWRLPKDEEWIRAASERFYEEKLLINSDDPSKRWLAEYAQQYNERADGLTELRSIGGYGENSLGLSDMAGAVWEWTQTCMLSGEVTKDGLTLTDRSEYCGVRIAEGRHRALMINFVRDPKVGGCAVGLPPSYLGFRLVREKYQR